MLCYLTSFWCMLLLPSTMLAPRWALILLAYVGLPPRCCSDPRVVFFPKIILASGEVFMELEAPVHFVLKVFDRIHVGEFWTPW